MTGEACRGIYYFDRGKTVFMSVLCLLLGKHLTNSISDFSKIDFTVCDLYAQAMLSNYRPAPNFFNIQPYKLFLCPLNKVYSESQGFLSCWQACN